MHGLLQIFKLVWPPTQVSSVRVAVARFAVIGLERIIISDAFSSTEKMLKSSRSEQV